MPEAGDVHLAIYNPVGQVVRTLIQNFQNAGSHQILWDGKDERGHLVSSGMYFYRLTSNGFTQTRRMMLLK